MSQRQPPLKSQVRLLREALATTGADLSSGQLHDLVAQLNGYANWNVAAQVKPTKRTSRASSAEVTVAHQEPQTLVVKVWTAVHTHRHGEDVYLFGHPPTEEEAIAYVKEVSSFDPSDDESIQVMGCDTVTVNLRPDTAMAVPQTPLIGVFEVYMPDLVEDADPEALPETRPEWQWIEKNASFKHQGNGCAQGVWEFMVHEAKLREATDIPDALKGSIDRALGLGAVWVMFYQ